VFKQTVLITFRPETAESARSELLSRAGSAVSADLSIFASTLPDSFMGGDVVWHLHFASREAWEASAAEATLDILTKEPSIVGIDAAAYEPRRNGVRQPTLSNGVYRTLFVNVAAGTSPETTAQFEDELAAMPEYIPEIVNWAMNPTVASCGDAPWTHVWEQEFADISGLIGPYMTCAYHWSWVDRWFDPEMPSQIVGSGLLRHSASVLPSSVMAFYGTQS
jgi:hypothetical protein